MTCDNTAELLAVKLRPGNAGANTAADHLDVLAQAVAQVPAKHRRHLLIRGNSAAATHAVLDWFTQQDSERGRRVEHSLGWSIGETERSAITGLPASTWSSAIDADGGMRDGVAVAELTGLLHLPCWPARMRSSSGGNPGAQLTLFEEQGGWRYTEAAPACRRPCSTHPARLRGVDPSLPAYWRMDSIDIRRSCASRGPR